MAKKAITESAQDQQQPYDNLLKSLLEGQEKQMLPYFVPGVEYVETLNVEVVRTPLRVDRVYLVKQNRRKKIVHLEFESGPNNDMAVRLLDYHTYLYRRYKKLPVISMIVYPFPTKMAESPLREVDENGEILTFYFQVFPLPGLTELAQERVAQINKPEKLSLLFEQVAVAPDEKMVRLLLDLAA